MAYIEDYLTGVKCDLEHVIPEDGHPFVKASILNSAERLANAAKANHEYNVMMMSDFYDDFVAEYSISISKEKFMNVFDEWLKTGHISKEMEKE